ncbi:hypothetical protein RF11_10838 [Thelohanellus kitauei]|uniref:Uncharacterized protein n=1 Tax=Thelohanellus kitauei TaxID=669202 RepID=A0A0C2M8Z9_THEKT|nr:hypothetical protein RF11_10838 [Thelohanellus kitauei]
MPPFGTEHDYLSFQGSQESSVGVSSFYGSCGTSSSNEPLPHGSYIVIFTFNRLLTEQHLLRNFVQCERSASREALVGFEKVRQLDLSVLMHLLLLKAELSRSKSASHIVTNVRETFPDHQLADLLTGMLYDLYSFEQREVELISLVNGFKPSALQKFHIVAL